MEARSVLLDEVDVLLAGPDPVEEIAMMLATRVGDAAAIARIADGMVEPLAFGHREPRVVELLRKSYPPQPVHRSRMTQLLLRSGGPVLIERIDPREFRTLSPTEYSAERGVYSVAMAAVRFEGAGPHGVVSLSREQPGEPYGEDERDFVDAVGLRLAAVL